MQYESYKKYVKNYKFEFDSRYNLLFDTEENQVNTLRYFNEFSSKYKTYYSDKGEVQKYLKDFNIESLVAIEYFNSNKEICLYVLAISEGENIDSLELLKQDSIAQQILSQNENKAIKIHQKDFFYCFLNNTHWLCPIEYYDNWWNEVLNGDGTDRRNVGPYDKLNELIKTEFKQDFDRLNIDSVYFSNKEKFASWRFEHLYITLKEEDSSKNTKWMSISSLKEIDENLYYKLFFTCFKFLTDYKNANPLTSFDWQFEWTESFGIELSI